MSLASERKTLLLFDVDGTLAASGQQCSEEMLQVLQRLSSAHSNVDCGVVGGGSLKKIEWQLGGAERGVSALRWLFAENGLVTGDGKVHDSLRTAVKESDLQHAIDLCLRWIADTRLPFKRGQFLDFRNALIYVTPIGSQCTAAERERFARLDSMHGFRLQLLRHLRSDARFNANFECVLGGQIGVGIFPRGFDKTYCLRHIDAYTAAGGAEYERIFFIGDRCTRNGNDYPLFSSERTIAYETSGPEHTLQLLHHSIMPQLV